MIRPVTPFRVPHRRVGMTLNLPCFILLVWFPAQDSRADNIDNQLIGKSADLVKSLDSRGFKNVGVLKFLVKKGNAPVDGNAGALNLNMAERVENALILAIDDSSSLGVIRGATEAAANMDPRFSIRTMEARKRLFAYKYPLAWGNSKVSPDAFLTGTVDLSPDMKKTTVEIGYFDRSGILQPLQSFELKTDRSILADAGQSFALSQRSLKKRSLAEIDDDAASSAAKADQGTSIEQQLSNQGDARPVTFEIRYNNQPQQLLPDGNSPGEFQVPTPQKGTAVTFSLTNNTQNKLGVVVKVNGINTVDKETNEDAACTKWVLEPGKQYMVAGFYKDNKVERFTVLDNEESAALMADGTGKLPKPGFIDVSVFSEGPLQSDEAIKIARSLRNPVLRDRNDRPATLRDAQSFVRRSAGVADNGSRKRGFIMPGQSEDATLQRDELKNPTQGYQLHISYYKTGSQ